MAGVSKDFNIGVGVHQGSILSLLLFIVVMDEVKKEERRLEMELHGSWNMQMTLC